MEMNHRFHTLRPELVDAVRGGDEVAAVYERGPAGVDVVVLVLLQDGRLPRVLRCRYK